MRRARWISCLLLTAIAVFLASHSVTTASSGKSGKAERKVRRAVQQSRIDEIKRHNLDLDNVRALSTDGGQQPLNFDQSIFAERRSSQSGHRYSSSTPPAPSPGTAIAVSVYDYQDNFSAGRHVARMPGADIVHFTWMGWEIVDPFDEYFDRFVYYNSYSISGGTLNQGFGGERVDLGINARAGYPEGDVLDDNTFQMALHQRPGSGSPYQPYHLSFPTPGSESHSTQLLGGFGPVGCDEVLWSRTAASRDGDGTVHVLAHTQTTECPSEILWYWRYDGATWTGPVIVDSTRTISYVIADDPTGDKLAVAVHVDNYTSMNGINNVAYSESMTDGAGWIAGTEPIVKTVITNYSTVSGPGAWLHLSTCYDNAGVLHIAYDEQRFENLSSDVAIKHWNSQRQTVRTVALGYWDSPQITGVFNLNLAKLTMGIGDGSTMCQGGAESNQDYVYILYTQFGGLSPEEEADHSLKGYYNGELYLTASTTGGTSWSTPVNLTNTKTPNCDPGPPDTLTMQPTNPDGVCRSEHWASIGLAVSDIDIFFISDLDAGGAPQAEGSWQLNPVHYLRIPGGTTDAQHLCPQLTPNFEASITSRMECEYHATSLGQNVETLTIMNLGNAELNGIVSVTDFPGAPTLTVTGSGPYTIPAGAADLVKTVTMASNSAPEGLYSGVITITHNDPSEASPRVFPIDFFVFHQWFCPESVPPMMTGAVGQNGPGSLYLELSNTGTFGSTNEEGALWRYSDSSSSIAAGSILVAHGPQIADTTVYLDFYNRPSNGQNGFRVLGQMEVDQAAYGASSGYACTESFMCTADSVVGIQCQWAFPQTQSRDEVVLARYSFYRHKPSVPIENLVVGLLVDMNVLPASRLGLIQNGVTNSPGSDSPRNLVWQQGIDTCCAVLGETASRFRTGIVVPGGFEGALVGNAYDDLAPGGGPTDGHLYHAMTSLIGIDLFSDSATDLYTLIALDRDRSIAPNETLSYYVILASDTVSEASLKSLVDQTISWAPSMPFCVNDGCPCWADPECDGIRSDVLDVVKTVNVAFRGAWPLQDPGCWITRSDVNADNATDVLDVVRVINVAFRGRTVAEQYVYPN